jgi:hypothetical protein
MTTHAIGQVDTADGEVLVTRTDGTQEMLTDGDPVFQGDVLETGEGSAVGILFIDDTTFSLGENAKMELDQLIFDPESGEGNSAFSVLQGAFVFVSGEIAKDNPENMTVRTPVATIGIRGTKVAGRIVVTEDGEIIEVDEASLITLLEGEIFVENGGGFMILSVPSQSTQISSFVAPPGRPFILSADELDELYGNELSILPQQLGELVPEAGPGQGSFPQGGTFRADGSLGGGAGDGNGNRVGARGPGEGIGTGELGGGTDLDGTFAISGEPGTLVSIFSLPRRRHYGRVCGQWWRAGHRWRRLHHPDAEPACVRAGRDDQDDPGQDFRRRHR